MRIIGVVIVDGVGYRNFVLSKFLEENIQAGAKIIIFSGLKREIYGEIAGVEVVELEVYRENKLTWIFRKAKELAHLHKNKDSFSIANNLKNRYPKTKSIRSYITLGIYKFTSFFHGENWIRSYYQLQCQSFLGGATFKHYKTVLKRNNCDILFFTHQRPPYLAPLEYAAKKQGIKTCSFIFSWDNLPSKGRMAAPFQSFLVWSELMKEELNHFYPETKNLPVEVVGTPQFEPYVLDRYQSSKDFFQKKFNIDPYKRTICYSCGDASTSKNDPIYIETIAGFIEAKKLREEVNFIVRTSPAEDGSRFNVVAERYSFIKWNYPQWVLTREDHPEPWSQRVPEKEDLVTLRALLQYCDLNINMCSTMSLDFMLFDKPVINLAFGTELNGLYHDEKYLKYPHYERVVRSGAVAIAKNKDQLLKEINFSLENPQARLKEQKELLALQIGKPLEGTSNRIAKTLRELV